MDKDNKINKGDSIIPVNQEDVNVNEVVSQQKMCPIDKDTLDAINIVASLSNIKFVFDESTMELLTETLDGPGSVYMLRETSMEAGNNDSLEESSTFKKIKVHPYDEERKLYIELEHNLLIAERGEELIAVGFFLNDELLPLTDELKTIIRKDYDGLTICDH